jgi:O-succinylbenzoate synthase
MAKAAVEEAYCDFEARQKGVPLWRFLGGSAEPIPCGVAIGIMSSIDDLLALVEKEVSSGYRRIKLKIQRGWDVAVVAAVRRTFPALALMVDANGAYTLDDIDALAQLDAYDLLMLEQPFAPDDLWAFKQAHDRFNTPICLDESIVSLASTRAALKLGLCSMVNIKLGRVGGHSVAREIVNLCTSEGIPCWCGGQHEAGIGRAHNLAMASLIPRIVPAELSASERYWDEDIISPPIQVDNKGYLQPPTAPGLGFVVNEDLVLQCTVRETHHQG